MMKVDVPLYHTVVLGCHSLHQLTPFCLPSHPAGCRGTLTPLGQLLMSSSRQVVPPSRHQRQDELYKNLSGSLTEQPEDVIERCHLTQG